LSKVRDRDLLVRADVVGAAYRSLKENRPKPNSQISRIKVRPVRGSILYLNWIPSHGIADEVTDGEVCVERKMGADKGEAPGDGGLQAVLLMSHGAEELSDTLSLSIS
jgi:hypothetical protein